MIGTIEELVEKQFSGKPAKRLAIVCADSDHTLEGVMRAHSEGLVRPILIGDQALIKPILNELKYYDDMEFIQANSKEDSIKAMVELVHSKGCDAIMKGNMDTKDILGAVVKKKHNLTKRDVLNSITLMQIPGYHKLMMFADPGMLIAPTLEQKVGIIHNCLDAFRAFGYERPKVAVLSAVEKVNPKIKATVDASALMDMADAGEFGECEIYGPLPWDTIINKEAAKIKGVISDVCGDADLVLTPDINCGNALTKSLGNPGHARGGGAALGAKVPVLVPSRASSATGKYISIIIGCACFTG